MQNVKRSGHEFKGWHLLTIMLCFFGTIIAVNITMATIASQSWTGLVVKNTYVESQKFNGYLEEAAKQKALGWTSNIEVQGNLLTFSLYDQASQPLKNFQVTGMAGRPAHENEDRKLTFVQNSAGQYVLEEPLSKGAWKLKITAIGSNDQRYRQDFQIIVKKE